MVLVPLSRRRRRQSGRTNAYGAGRGRITGSFSLRVCVLPALGAGLLRRLPAHSRRRSGADRLSRRLHLRIGDRAREGPQYGTPEPHTLEDYRIRHALYKTDPELRAAHAHCPWIVTWDDHEVANDYADDRGEALNGREWLLARRAAAYRAYFEHLPLRRQMVPFGPHMRLYHRVAFGRLVQFHLLDDRQYRGHQPCTPAGRGGSANVEQSAERLDPKLSLLGVDQEKWLEAGLDRSRARWNVLGQQ